MAGLPRLTVEDDFVTGLTCAICGQPELYVQHLPSYPDFVTCRSCGAAFVVEDSGERVMYGKLPDGYPDTTEFALRQWVWLEAVERRATAERPVPEVSEAPSFEAALRSTLAEEPEIPSEPEPAKGATAEPVEPTPDWLSARLRTDGMPAGVPIPTEPEPYRAISHGVPLAPDTGPTDESLPSWLRESPPPVAPRVVEPSRPTPAPAVAAPLAAVAVQSPAVAAKPAVNEGEPPPTHRHRVVVRGDRIRMPVNACAHCQQAPAPDRLPVPGSLPRPGSPARRNTTFQVPLCKDCSRRAKSRTTEQSGSRLMALLTGALVGLILVVVILATGIVPFATSLGLGLLMLGVIWFIGFGLTAGVLLNRAGRQAPSPDAHYVRTTLRVVPDSEAPQTAFEWRNRETAHSFFQANGPAAVAEPVAISEPVAA